MKNNVQCIKISTTNLRLILEFFPNGLNFSQTKRYYLELMRMCPVSYKNKISNPFYFLNSGSSHWGTEPRRELWRASLTAFPKVQVWAQAPIPQGYGDCMTKEDRFPLEGLMDGNSFICPRKAKKKCKRCAIYYCIYNAPLCTMRTHVFGTNFQGKKSSVLIF